MLIATLTYRTDKLEAAMRSPDSLRRYVESLVPAYARHIPGIVDNQKYITAQHIRKMEHLPYTHRKNVVSNLLEGVSVKGYIGSVITLEDLLVNCDFDLLFNKLFLDGGEGFASKRT